jgi:hypothetical protein
LPTDRGILATITRDTGGPNEILEVGRDGLLA